MTYFYNYIWGTHSDDTLQGKGGNDVIFGGGGDDKIFGGDGNDVIFGGSGNDTIFGGDGRDVIFAGDGDDFIVGGFGLDRIHGGSGNDTISWDNLDSGLSVDLKKQRVRFNTGGSEHFSSIENIIGSRGDDVIKGDHFNNILRGNLGNDRLEGKGGNDVLVGGEGNDHLAGGDGNDTFFGDAGDDKSIGGKGFDFIFGGEGNDFIDGGKDFDKVDYSELGEAITLKAMGVIDKGAAGSDRAVNIEEVIGATDELNVIDGRIDAPNVSLNVDLGTNNLTIKNVPGVGDQVFTVRNFAQVIGTEQADTIVGDKNSTEKVFFFGRSGNDTLQGGGGDDDLFGEEGNDTFVGGTGSDFINGGHGFDTVDYSDLGQAVTLQGIGVVDKGSTGRDQLRAVEEIVGATGQINRIDAAMADSGIAIDVDLGAETLRARGIPGVGDRTYTIRNFSDIKGTDQGDSFLGDSNSTSRAFFFGRGGDDRITGGAGDDDLFGDAGDDTILSGQGNDFMVGGSGNDRLVSLGGVNEMNGSDAQSAGSHELDVLVGGLESDRFVLGDTQQAYYKANGESDFAEIRNFGLGEDLIILHGAISSYALSVNAGVAAIDYLGDRIATVQGAGASGLALEDSTFKFV